MKTLAEHVREERAKLDANTFQFLRWLKSDEELWSDLTYIQRWVEENPPPRGIRWSEVWERGFEAVRAELREMLRSVSESEDNPYSLDFMCEVDLDQILDMIEDDNLLLGYIEDPFKLESAERAQAKAILFKSRINGKETLRFEDFGGNVGPVVEPNLGAEEVAQVLAECKDVREVAR